MNGQQRLLLKPTEVADQLGICRSRAYELINNGTIPGVIRLGKSIRVSSVALEEWVSATVAEQSESDRQIAEAVTA